MSTQRKQVADYCRITRAAMFPHRRAANNLCRIYIRRSQVAKQTDATEIVQTTVCMQVAEFVQSFIRQNPVKIWQSKKI